VSEYRNPRNDYGCETGVDVIAVVGGRKIGFQVTEYDSGEGNSGMRPGQSRGVEKRLREAPETRRKGVYAGFGSPDVERPLRARIAGKVAKSLEYDFASYSEVWLLVSAYIPDAPLSTFVPYLDISSDLLNRWTAAMLAGSRYSRAFFHIIMVDVLFGWDRIAGWRKLADRQRERQSRGHQGP